MYVAVKGGERAIANAHALLAKGTAMLGIFHDAEVRGIVADRVLDVELFSATEAEITRRNPAALTARQRELLKAWGYPYVLEEFRFHLTLTDRIPQERRPEVERTLNAWFGDFLGGRRAHQRAGPVHRGRTRRPVHAARGAPAAARPRRNLITPAPGWSG